MIVGFNDVQQMCFQVLHEFSDHGIEKASLLIEVTVPRSVHKEYIMYSRVNKLTTFVDQASYR